MYLTFIDFKKAFDSVNRRVMWSTLQVYGIPVKILNICNWGYAYDNGVVVLGYGLDIFRLGVTATGGK
jgi:hypothetical protein